MASPPSHSLDVANRFSLRHMPDMDSHDKNGGPNFLRQWREHRRLSQAALAEKIGTTPNVIHYLETGERALSAKWLRKIAPVLDTTPGMLLDHDPTQLDADILDIWAHASSLEKRQISELAKTLIRTGTQG